MRLTNLQVEVINPLFLLTAKPVVYLVNLSEKDYIRQKNKHLPKIAQWVKEHAEGDPIIPISVSFEERLTRFESDAEVAKECETLGTKSALPKVIVTMRKALKLGSFFTTGTDEVRQWTIREGTKAPQAAGVIHGDFEKTFIQAIVCNYKALREEGDEAAVKAHGKIMTKGKEYVVEDGEYDIISNLKTLLMRVYPFRRYTTYQSRRGEVIISGALQSSRVLLLSRCLINS